MKLKTDLKIIIRQYLKMGVQNLLLPAVYELQKPKQIEPGLVIFADAHNEKVPSAMASLVREVKRRKNKRVIEFYDDYQSISFGRLLKRMICFIKFYAMA